MTAVLLLVVLPPFVSTDLLCLVSLRVRGVVGVQLHERAHHGVHSGGSGDQRRRSAHRDDWLAVLLVLGCECALHHAEICGCVFAVAEGRDPPCEQCDG